MADPVAAGRAELDEVARRLRRSIITMVTEAGSGHPGGSLSAVEILSSLYFRVMRHRASEPSWPDRDRFILSKAHACPVLYAALAEAGYFPEEELSSFRKLDSRLQGHAHVKTPGVEMSGGSLGQGLSFGVGTALASRLDGRPSRTYVLLGDGESATRGRCGRPRCPPPTTRWTTWSPSWTATASRTTGGPTR